MQKWMTPGCVMLGHSNWTICNRLSLLCSKKNPPFYPVPHNKPFPITPERGRKEGEGAENGKRESPKSEKDTGVSDLGAFKRDHLQPFKLILFQKHPPFYPAPYNKPFPNTPERERKEGAGAENGKRESPKSEWDTGVSDLGVFKFDHLQPVKLLLFQNYSTFLPSSP